MSKMQIRHLILISAICGVCGLAEAQYRSRLFIDPQQTLSDSELDSIAALEQAFSALEDDYQIALSGQSLARQMLAAKEYEKAAQYYAKALQSDSLDELARIPLRREYAQVLLLLTRYVEVTEVYTNVTLQAEDRLLLARASLAQQKFHRTVAWLQPVLEQLPRLDEPQVRQLAAIFYHAQSPALAAQALQYLAEKSPHDIDLARQLTTLHMQADDYSMALARWALMASAGLLQREQDWLLLVELYNRNDAPEKAARTLQQTLEAEQIAVSAERYYQLFSLWYASKEIEQARRSLWLSVQLQPTLERGIVLTELYQQAEQWPNMERVIALLCEQVLPDAQASRVNVLLGIARHKQGDNQQARRAFINAQLLGGLGDLPQQWLDYIDAEPPSAAESRRLWGDCLPAETDIKLPEYARSSEPTFAPQSTQKVNESGSQEVSAKNEPLTIVELPDERFYASTLTTTLQSLKQDVTRKTFSLVKSLVRSGGGVDDKLHLFFDGLQSEHEVALTMGFPYSGVPMNSAGNRVVRMPAARAVTIAYQGPADGLAAQWESLITRTIAKGLSPTGESRLIIVNDAGEPNQLNVELQLLIEQ